MSEYLRIDKNALLRSIFSDREILEEVLQAFCDDTARICREMIAAGEGRNLPKGAEAMHALKGIFSSVAAFSEAREAEYLEKEMEKGNISLWDRGTELLSQIPGIREDLERLLEEMA